MFSRAVVSLLEFLEHDQFKIKELQNGGLSGQSSQYNFFSAFSCTCLYPYLDIQQLKLNKQYY